MAIDTKGSTVGDMETQIFVLGKIIQVMCVKVRAAFSAILASVIVSFKNGGSPFFVSATLAGFFVFCRYAAIPQKIIRAGVPSVKALHRTEFAILGVVELLSALPTLTHAFLTGDVRVSAIMGTKDSAGQRLFGVCAGTSKDGGAVMASKFYVAAVPRWIADSMLRQAPTFAAAVTDLAIAAVRFVNLGLSCLKRLAATLANLVNTFFFAFPVAGLTTVFSLVTWGRVKLISALKANNLGHKNILLTKDADIFGSGEGWLSVDQLFKTVHEAVSIPA